MRSKFLLILTFVGVFLFGAIAGGATVARWGRQVVERRTVERASLQQWKRLADDLQLTDAQREQIKPILRQAAQERLEGQRQQQRSAAKFDKQLEEVLTPAQMDKYREFRAKGHDRDKRWQKWLREMRNRNEAPPAGPAPTPTP